MRLSRFLKRHVPGFCLHPIRDVAGARIGLIDRGTAISVPYRGMFEKHLLLMVKEGTVVLEREGFTCEAGSGEAMLIAQGTVGQLTFSNCPRSGGLSAWVCAFDERTLAHRLRDFRAWETLARTDFPKVSATVIENVDVHPNPICFPSHIPRSVFSRGMGALIHQLRPPIASFFRDHFYQHRWKFLNYFERYIIPYHGLEIASQNYPGGQMRFRRDSLLYLGIEPRAAFARRRAELAGTWLRCGHSIDAVAQALNFTSRWEFECFFSGVVKRRCADIQRMNLLAELPKEDFYQAITPFYWKELRKPVIDISQDAANRNCDRFEPTLPPLGIETADQTNNSPPKADSDVATLNKQKQEFMEMKTTGAEIIVATFKYAPPIELAA